MKMYRQGDLLFVEAKALGENTDLLKDQKVILGSSVTGHEHKITKGEIYAHQPTGWDNANFYINAPAGTFIEHDEHGTIELPPGIYKVIRQREVTGYVVD